MENGDGHLAHDSQLHWIIRLCAATQARTLHFPLEERVVLMITLHDPEIVRSRCLPERSVLGLKLTLRLGKLELANADAFRMASLRFGTACGKIT